MPPWLPDPGLPPMVGERILPAGAIETIRRWVETGAVEGDPADLPKAPTWPTGWELGQPDLVVTTSRPFVLAKGTEDVYRNLVLPIGMTTARFVRAVEFRTNGAPIHHAVVRIDRTHASRGHDGADGQPGFDGMVAEGVQDPNGHFIGWAPGRGPIVAPDRLPWPLDRGSDLVVELHLLPGTTPVAVSPSVGLFFTDTAPAAAPVMIVMGSKAIDIPAGATQHAIEDSYQLPVDVDVLSVYPHAHYLGKEMTVRASLPDGSHRPLIHVRQWSFHWQQDYRLVTPIRLPRGSTIVMRYTYDNSASNKANPHNPPRRVTWGQRSSDEMGTLGVQLLPRGPGDAAVLVKSFAEHAARADVDGAETLVRADPGKAHNQTLLGSSYVRVGRHAEAIPHLERALALEPRSATAHNQLGGALLALGRSREALEHFRRASALAPRDEHLHYNLGKMLDAAGRTEDAAREFTQAIALNPDFAEAHQQLGVIFFSHNRLPEALVHLGRAVDLAPASPAAHSDLGGALAQAGRFDEAMAQIRLALALDPAYVPARDNLDRLARQRRR